MDINNKNMCANEVRKAALLITCASKLGMDVAGYGHADVNTGSGNTYLWLEDYPFCLYIPPCGEDDIWVIYTDEDGEEHEMPMLDNTLDSIYAWVDLIERGGEEEEEEDDDEI